MDSISKRTLVYLLIVAIFVSLMGTLLSLNKLGELDITGLTLGNDTGVVNLTISSSCSVSMTGTDIDFGSGTVNGSRCALNTSSGTKSTGCKDFAAIHHGLNFTNDGNENISLNITSNVTADSFLGGASPFFKIKANNTESGACNSGGFGNLSRWVDVVAEPSKLTLCNSTNQLNPEEDEDTLEIDVYLNISSGTGGTGGFAELKLIGIC